VKSPVAATYRLPGKSVRAAEHIVSTQITDQCHHRVHNIRQPLSFMHSNDYETVASLVSCLIRNLRTVDIDACTQQYNVPSTLVVHKRWSHMQQQRVRLSSPSSSASIMPSFGHHTERMPLRMADPRNVEHQILSR
jgi:hypothetical protein